MSIFEDIRSHLPPYLSTEQKKQLFEEIDKFPKVNFYTTRSDADELLQGDGWTGLTILDFNTGNRKKIKGIILSNSCDIDLNNKRDSEVNIIFAPIIKLENYIHMLNSAGVPPNKIEDKIEAIKQQKTTAIMYLPKNENLEVDHILNFDDIRSQPLQSFLTEDRTKLFTLSQVGFYIFLLKISIHFCRFQEGIIRS